ncbi:MAG: hypothetical protein IJ542_00220 [Clostridia bacterium]|nr:hypothetical protein [Clostridia bacterium]
MKKLSNILLYGALGVCGAWTILLALGAFGVLNIASIAGSHFNYVWALVIVVVCLLCYVAFMFVEKIRNLIIPDWFKCLFYLAFLIFTNVYYLFSWYHTIAGTLVFVAYLAVLFNILSVSLFYNTQKDAKNIVKTTDRFLVFSAFSYASLGIVIYEVIALLVKAITKSTSVLSGAAMIVTEISLMLCVNFVFAILFAMSLKKTKQFINACLIKYNQVSDYKTNKNK